MSDERTEDFIPQITNALLAYPYREITGSRVNEQIKKAAPELNIRETVGILTGPGALSTFIEKYLSGILQRIGNQGGDTLFEILGSQSDKHTAPSERSLWKTFVSPASEQHLVIDPQSLTIRVQDDAPDQNSPLSEIQKVSEEEHDRIRDHFHKTLPTESLEKLMNDDGSHLSFNNWISILRTEFPEDYKRWGKFRIEKLTDVFKQRIDNFDLSIEQKSDLIRELHLSQHHSYEQRKLTASANHAETHLSERSSLASSEPAINARTFALEAIKIMRDDEIRSMPITIGTAIDVLKKKTILSG
ncbi:MULTISPECIES: hypothetical protein [Thalassospira]|nr:MULTISPECIES: hypothetical protein [Thalassospira]MBR9901803.1 hypothetical protein [Rhodospirillales bacterium]